jgi:hypothetical protein
VLLKFIFGPAFHLFSPTKGGVYHNRTHRCASFTSTRRFCHNLPVCGRYKLSRRKRIVEEYFDTASGEEDWSPRYNVAPTQPVPVVRQHPQEPVRELSLMRWGLIPSWSKDSSVAASMINARSETAATKPAFRDALKSRRCLIPADGFYEWRRTGKTEVSRSMKGSYSPSRDLGSLERPQWQLDENLFDPDHDAECRDLGRP